MRGSGKWSKKSQSEMRGGGRVFRQDSGEIPVELGRISGEKARISQALEIERGVQTAQLPFLLFNNNRSEALRKREIEGKFARVSFNYGSDYVLISF